MKNAYLAMLTLSILVFSLPSNATTNFGGGTILIVDDDVSTGGGCLEPTGGRKNLRFRVANIPAINCNPIRIQVLHAISGVELGMSDLIFFNNENQWDSYSSTTSNSCEASIFDRSISINISFSGDIDLGDTQFTEEEVQVNYVVLGTQNIEGSYVLIPDSTAPGGYELHYDGIDNCFNVLFPNNCFSITYPSLIPGVICVNHPDNPGPAGGGDGKVPKDNQFFSLQGQQPSNTLLGDRFNAASLNSNDQNLTIYPNPVNDVLKVSFNVLETANTFITIFDMSGNTLQVNQVDAIKGQNNVELNLHGLTNGIYLLKLFDGEATHLKRIVKNSF